MARNVALDAVSCPRSDRCPADGTRPAREFTTMVLGGWGMTGVSDLAEVSVLIASELRTKVIRGATGADGSPLYQADGRLTELWLRLMSDRARVQIEVWDNLPAGGAGGFTVLRFGPVPTLGLVHAAGPDGGLCPDTPVPRSATCAHFNHLRAIALSPEFTIHRLPRLASRR